MILLLLEDNENQALKICTEHTIDMFLLDIELGTDCHKTGLDFVEEIRMKKQYSNIPIIFITAYSCDLTSFISSINQPIFSPNGILYLINAIWTKYLYHKESSRLIKQTCCLKSFLIILKPIPNIPNTLYLIRRHLVGVKKFFAEITDTETDCFPFTTRRKIAPHLFIDLVVGQHTVSIGCQQAKNVIFLCC